MRPQRVRARLRTNTDRRGGVRAGALRDAAMLRGEKSAGPAGPGGVTIGTTDRAVPDGKCGPIDGSTRRAFSVGERGGQSIEG